MNSQENEMAWFHNRKARGKSGRRASTEAFSSRVADKVRRFHGGTPSYRPTPLVRLKKLAESLGVKDIRAITLQERPS